MKCKMLATAALAAGFVQPAAAVIRVTPAGALIGLGMLRRRRA